MDQENSIATTTVTAQVEPSPVQPEAPSAPATQAPEAPAPSPYREVASLMGLQSDGIEDIKAHWGKVQGDLAEREKRLAETEGRLGGISPLLLGVQEELVRDGFAGSDAEIMQRLHAMLGKGMTDYAKMAGEDPERMLAEGLMLSQGLTQAEAALSVKHDKHALRKAIEEQNPEATEAEVATELAQMMSIKARAHMKALEDSKPKFGIRPQGMETPEQAAQRKAREQAEVNNAYAEALRGFSGFDLGELGKWDARILSDDGQSIRPEYSEVAATVADPNKFLSRFFKDGRFLPSEALRYEMSVLNLPKVAAAKAAEAVGKGLKGAQDQMQGINGGSGSTNPGGSGAGQSLNDVIKQRYG